MPRATHRSCRQGFTPLAASLLRSGAADWYHALPPITRSLLTCYVVTGLAFYLGVMPLQYFYHDWGRIFKRLPEVGWWGGCVARCWMPLLPPRKRWHQHG